MSPTLDDGLFIKERGEFELRTDAEGRERLG